MKIPNTLEACTTLLQSVFKNEYCTISKHTTYFPDKTKITGYGVYISDQLQNFSLHSFEAVRDYIKLIIKENKNVV